MQIDVKMIVSWQSGDERMKIVNSLLLKTYACGATGLNLQKKCRRIHLVESAYNLAYWTVHREAI